MFCVPLWRRMFVRMCAHLATDFRRERRSGVFADDEAVVWTDFLRGAVVWTRAHTVMVASAASSLVWHLFCLEKVNQCNSLKA